MLDLAKSITILFVHLERPREEGLETEARCRVKLSSSLASMLVMRYTFQFKDDHVFEFFNHQGLSALGS